MNDFLHSLVMHRSVKPGVQHRAWLTSWQSEENAQVQVRCMTVHLLLHLGTCFPS